jgi:hypothetical protein
MTRTVLLPHNTVLGELNGEQRVILGALTGYWHRVLPLGCFLPNTGESLESWKSKITECRILPPVLRGDCVVYPVDIPGVPGLGIVTAVSGLQTTERSEFRQITGDFRERALRVFRLCEMTFLESGTVTRWTIDRTIWIKREKSAILTNYE